MRLDHLLSKESHRLVRLVHAFRRVVGGVGVSLLSLIPCLVEQSLHVCAVAVGVAGWNTSAAWFERCSGLCGWRLGTLLGPEETPVWVFFRCRLLGWASNASCVCCGCGGVGGSGVWLCVECCIVDASILLWSSV